MKPLTGLVVLALVIAACGSQPESVANAPAASEPPASAPSTVLSPTTVPPTQPSSASPPNLQVMTGDEALMLSPSSYCWFVGGEGVCADGAPREPLPSLTVASDSQLTIAFPLDWEMTATLLPDGEYCSGEKVITADPGGSPIEALGPAGAYRVDVFGRGEGGDGAWAFELIVGEALPAPTAYWQVFWSPSGGMLDEEAGFFALIGNVSTRPSEVSAVVSVEASDGAAEDVDLVLGDDGGCWASIVGFEGGAGFTRRVIELGPSPYSLVLTVTLDGRTITGDPLEWPSDFPANSNESARASAS